MSIDALRRPLGIDEIDFRVQSVNKGGYATILAYKDARADMTRLDEAVTALGWKREHTNGNANCTVSLYDDKTNQWVSKEDTGSESNAEAAKGLASDSFKRACFNWGIGRELYDYPVISVKLNANEVDLTGNKPKSTWNLKLKEWTWFSQFDEDGKLTYLAAKDQNEKKRFVWGEYNPTLFEQTAGGKTSNSEPENESPTPEPKEEGNVDGVLKAKAEPIEKAPEEDERRAELVAEYEKLFGRKPHGKASIETIEVKIDEKLAEVGNEEEKTQEAVYSAPGEPAEDPYSGEMKEIKPKEVEVEEVEAEEVDLGMHGGPIADFANKIDTFTDREALKTWAIKAIHEISAMTDVPSDHKDDFKAAVNKTYEKLS
jgi:hypothetical protein